MNNPTPNENPAAEPSREDMMSALFANLVVQHTNMAFIFLGRMPHPETKEIMRDLDSAKFFIDQLEMLDVKTRNNLNKQEEGLLKQSLMSLRMAYVDAVSKPQEGSKDKAAEKAAETTSPVSEPTSTGQEKPDADDSRKKFSKKY